MLFTIFANFLEAFSYFIYLVAVTISWYHQRDGQKLLLLLYYVLATGIMFYASLLSHFNTMGDNNWLYNLFFLITIIVFSHYFRQLLKDKRSKQTVTFCLLINLLCFIYNDIILKQFHKYYNNYVIAVCFLTIVVYALLYFYQQIDRVSENNLLLQLDFWLISSYLLYFLGAFFVVLFYGTVSLYTKAYLWGFQNLILFISSLVTLVGSAWIGYQGRKVPTFQS